MCRLMGVSGPVCVLDRLGGRCTGEGVSERAARMHRTGGGITMHTPEIAKDDASCNNWVQPDLTPATFSTPVLTATMTWLEVEGYASAGDRMVRVDFNLS